MIDATTKEVRVLTALGPIHIEPCGSDTAELPPGDRKDAEDLPVTIDASVHDLYLYHPNEPLAGQRVLRLILDHISGARPQWWQMNLLGLDDRRALLNAVLGKGENQ